MAIVKVYDRNRLECGEIDTEDFVFSNYSSAGGVIENLDKVAFPYVKIDGVYFQNDGNTWEYVDGNKTAKLMRKECSYLWDNNVDILSKINFNTTTSYQSPELYNGWLSKSPLLQKKILSKYRINGKYLQVWSAYKNKDLKHKNLHLTDLLKCCII